VIAPDPNRAPADETDEALVARLARQDQDALRQLHSRYAALVFAVAVRFVGEATAEEVVQDVFVTLWKKHDSFDPARGAFKPWLAQITRRRALNARRASKVENHDPEALDQLEADVVSPDEASWLAHRRAVVRAAVDALPEAQRQALSLAFFDDLTHEQIARVLGTPLGTAKTRVRTALKRLAPLLLAAMAVVAAIVVLKRQEETAARNTEALRMVTASDVVPLHLVHAPTAPPEAHGAYRMRPGARVAVLTTSDLPPPPARESYVGWAHDARGWRRLGPVVVESDRRSLLVVEVHPEDGAPDELRVTREGRSTGAAPSGPTMLDWTAAR
jgi:RNA polymerase sigma-70 factor (ECF subfamily)